MQNFNFLGINDKNWIEYRAFTKILAYRPTLSSGASFLKTDRSWIEYRALTKILAYRPHCRAVQSSLFDFKNNSLSTVFKLISSDSVKNMAVSRSLGWEERLLLTEKSLKIFSS